MKKLAFVVLFVFVCTNTFAQQHQSYYVEEMGTAISSVSYYSLERVNQFLREIESSYRMGKTPEELNAAILKDIEGSPYMNDEFVKGDLLTTKSEMMNGILLRYNVYDNEMEVKVKEIAYEVPAKDLVMRVILEDKTFDYLPFQVADEEKQIGYLELIKEGEWNLYCRHSKKYKEAQPPKAMQENGAPAKFIDKPVVYFLKKNQDDVAFGFKNKKQLVNLFPEHEKKVQEFISKNKLKYNDPEDLKKLLNFCNIL